MKYNKLTIEMLKGALCTKEQLAESCKPRGSEVLDNVNYLSIDGENNLIGIGDTQIGDWHGTDIDSEFLDEIDEFIDKVYDLDSKSEKISSVFTFGGIQRIKKTGFISAIGKWWISRSNDLGIVFYNESEIFSGHMLAVQVPDDETLEKLLNLE